MCKMFGSFCFLKIRIGGDKLTEIILYCQTVFLMKIWNREILQYTVFLSAEKIVLMSVGIRLNTLQNTAISVSTLPAELCTGLKKTVTLKSKNLFLAEYNKRTYIGFTKLLPNINFGRQTIQNPLQGKRKALSQNCQQNLQSSKTNRITNRAESKTQIQAVCENKINQSGSPKSVSFLGRGGTVEWVIFRAFARKWAIWNLWRRKAG